MSAESHKFLQQALQWRRENRLDDARRALLEAVGLCRHNNAPLELAQALKNLGQIESDLNHPDAALLHYEEAAAIYRDAGDALKLAHTVRHVADIHRRERRSELAGARYREALTIYRSHDQTSPLDLANAIRGLAILKTDAGNAAEAKLLWREAKNLYELVSVEAGVAESSRRLLQLAQTEQRTQ